MPPWKSSESRFAKLDIQAYLELLARGRDSARTLKKNKKRASFLLDIQNDHKEIKELFIKLEYFTTSRIKRFLKSELGLARLAKEASYHRQAYQQRVSTPAPIGLRYHDNCLHYVTEGVKAIPLRQLYFEAFPTFELTPETWRELIETIMKLHNAGMSHGDLHLGNILINLDQNKIWLVDFAFARKCKKPAAIQFTHNPKLPKRVAKDLVKLALSLHAKLKPFRKYWLLLRYFKMAGCDTKQNRRLLVESFVRSFQQALVSQIFRYKKKLSATRYYQRAHTKLYLHKDFEYLLSSFEHKNYQNSFKKIKNQPEQGMQDLYQNVIKTVKEHHPFDLELTCRKLDSDIIAEHGWASLLATHTLFPCGAIPLGLVIHNSPKNKNPNDIWVLQATYPGCKDLEQLSSQACSKAVALFFQHCGLTLGKPEQLGFECSKTSSGYEALLCFKGERFFEGLRNFEA